MKIEEVEHTTHAPCNMCCLLFLHSSAGAGAGLSECLGPVPLLAHEVRPEEEEEKWNVGNDMGLRGGEKDGCYYGELKSKMRGREG